MGNAMHCGIAAKIEHNAAIGMYVGECSKCGRKVAGRTEDDAVSQFNGSPKPAPNQAKPPKADKTDAKRTQKRTPPPTTAVGFPRSSNELPGYISSHMAEMRQVAIPFVANDKPALTRLVKNNLRYILIQSKDTLKKAWETPEGRESIVHALEESLTLAAELGRTGSLVPFRSVVEFIPAVEAYEFALCNGGNPPFRWIYIEAIHDNDVIDVGRVNGAFTCKVTPGRPRGELQQVAVYGHNNRLGIVVGELYDAERLLGKAKQHSSSYKYYLQDKAAFAMAVTEGKVKNEGGRPYTEKQMFKKGGGTWIKKLYEDEITNPYEGPDQPEMLRKAAGKSFLGKYARVRNSEAAMDEMKGTPEDKADALAGAAIDAAFEVVEQDGEPAFADDSESQGQGPMMTDEELDAEVTRNTPTEADIDAEVAELDRDDKQEELQDIY